MRTCTPGSINGLFGDMVKEFRRGCSRLFRGGVGRFLVEKSKQQIGTHQETTIQEKNPEKSKQSY